MVWPMSTEISIHVHSIHMRGSWPMWSRRAPPESFASCASALRKTITSLLACLCSKDRTSIYTDTGEKVLASRVNCVFEKFQTASTTLHKACKPPACRPLQNWPFGPALISLDDTAINDQCQHNSKQNCSCHISINTCPNELKLGL